MVAFIAFALLAIGGILLTVFLPLGGRHVVGTTSTTTVTVTTNVLSTTTAPPTTTVPPPTTAAPGPLRAVAVGPFSATVEWTQPDPPSRIAYGIRELGPTIWTPMANGRATLTGLRFRTTYRVWAGDAILDLTTTPAPPSPLAATDSGSILLGNQPFFPLFVLAQCPGGYENSLAAGITVFAENPCGGITEQTTALAGRALSLTSAREAGIGGSGVIGWYYPDEPDLKRMTGETLPSFPTQAVTGRLSVLTLSNHFYSRTQPLREGRGIYPGLIAKSDVVGFDLYPLQEFCKFDWLPDDAAAQRELVRLAAGRPTFQWIEVTTWKCKKPNLQVTPATIRAESWLAIAGGAHGLGFFPADWPAETTPAIATVAKEISALAAALLRAEVPASATAPVIASARRLNGAIYLIAVNPTDETVHATITAHGLADRHAGVLSESRTVTANRDSLVDSFGPLAVHVYVAAPS